MFKLRPPGIITITFLALVLRVVLASWSGLATDEANGVMIAVSGGWSDMLLHLKNDGNAPIFYALIKILDHELGHGDLAVKLISVVTATAIIPFCYAIFRTILPRHICLQLAWLLAFSPALIRYGTLVRPYALVTMLALLSSYTCIKVLTNKSSKLWIIPYGISTALVVYTHYWGAFVAIGQAGLAIIGLIKNWFSRKEFVHWLYAVALSLALFAPQVPTLIFQLQHDMSPWDTIRRPLYLIPYFLPGTILDIETRITQTEQFSSIICNLLIILAFASTARYVYKTTWTPIQEQDQNQPESEEQASEEQDSKELEKYEIEEFDSRKWKTLVICGLTACFLVNFILPSMRFRYILPFLPAIFVVYLTTADIVLANQKKWIRYLAPVLIWIVISVPQLKVLYMMPETNTGKIVDVVNKEADREKDLVVISWQVIAPAINYYLPRDIESVSYPDLNRSDFNHWPEMHERVKQAGKLSKLYKKLRTVLDQGGTVWLVERARDIGQEDPFMDTVEEAKSFEETFTIRMNQIHIWLRKNAVQKGNIQMAPGRDFPIFLTRFVKSS